MRGRGARCASPELRAAGTLAQVTGPPSVPAPRRLHALVDIEGHAFCQPLVSGFAEELGRRCYLSVAASSCHVARSDM